MFETTTQKRLEQKLAPAFFFPSLEMAPLFEVQKKGIDLGTLSVGPPFHQIGDPEMDRQAEPVFLKKNMFFLKFFSCGKFVGQFYM